MAARDWLHAIHANICSPLPRNQLRRDAMKRVRKNMFGLMLLLTGMTFAWPSTAKDWLPPQAAEGLARQFAGRMEAIEPSRKKDPAALLLKGREMVTRFSGQIAAWGEKGVLARAPKLAMLKLPTAKQPHLDAMARYQVCSFILMLQYEGMEQTDKRVVGAIGLSGVTMLVLSLRDPFIAAGGKTPQIEAFLTSAPMEAVTDRLQRDVKLLEAVQTECGPVVGALMATL